MYINFILAIGAFLVGVGVLFVKKQFPYYKDRFMAAGGLLIVASLVLLGSSLIRIVPAGTVGVVDLFGKAAENERKPGLNIVNPFANLVIMNVKTEEIKEDMTVPSKEGLSVKLEVSILYRLNPDMAADIYKKVGVNYAEVVIKPQFRSASRGVTVQFEVKTLYTSGRELVAEKVFEDLESLMADRGVILEKVLLRSIVLPPTVSKAIEMKLKAEQESEQMKFVLQKERQEADRRVIEAEGIAKSQEIINATLTNSYLQHEAIQAQVTMASSPNHTTVYIPVGTNGIPIVKTTGADETK